MRDPEPTVDTTLGAGHVALPGDWLSVRAAAEALRAGVADPAGRGLLLRGWEHAPVTLAQLDPATPLGIAASGLYRLAIVAEEVAELVSDHPSPTIRRAAALLAAQAHPLRAGLEAAPPAPTVAHGSVPPLPG